MANFAAAAFFHIYIVSFPFIIILRLEYTHMQLHYTHMYVHIGRQIFGIAFAFGKQRAIK